MDQKQSPDSTELALMAQQGDRHAFASLYERHAPGVARALASFVGPRRDLLDDLVQDVFLRVVEGLTTYHPSRPFEAWLFTIALNAGRNHARFQNRWRTMPLEEAVVLDGIAVGPECDPSVLDLFRLATGLPDELPDVVALRVGSDLSYDQIAELLDIPVGTARRRMHTATHRLRQGLTGGVPIERSSRERAR